MLELIGWIGSIAFAISGLPQAIYSYKQGHSRGITWGLIWCWWVGEWFSLIYVIPLGKLPLIINYLGNIVFVGVITYYKIWERKLGDTKNE